MAAQPRLYKPGQALFSDGDPSRSMFIIKKGAISIRKRRGNGTIEIGRALSGEVIGELSFFDRKPRSASAVAIIEVEAIEITFESLEKIYISIPDYMKTMVASLAERLRRANEMIIRLQKENPTRAAALTEGLSPENAVLPEGASEAAPPAAAITSAQVDPKKDPAKP
jgi:CRP/FNR family transcriptional regulator, cyclic AMP receptor protein